MAYVAYDDFIEAGYGDFEGGPLKASSKQIWVGRRPKSVLGNLDEASARQMEETAHELRKSWT